MVRGPVPEAFTLEERGVRVTAECLWASGQIAKRRGRGAHEQVKDIKHMF